MASYDTVNYSLRPNKAIQRQIVFDGLELLDRYLPLRNSVYIGFGSIWFVDFAMAHRRLGIRDMISIENKPIGAARGRFNAPFKTVAVREGESNVILQELANDDAVSSRQWIVWLDYDTPLSPEVLDDVRIVLTHAPENSIFLLTLNAGKTSVGNSPSKREANLRSWLGSSVSDDLTPADLEADNLPNLLIPSLQSYLRDQAVQLGRPGGYVPSFSIPYKDGAPMVTIGGVFPAQAARPSVKAALAEHAWPGLPVVPVTAPPLTLKEITAIQRLLPSDRPIARTALRKLGFDLEDEQLAAYCAHYLRYPAFLQVVT